MVKGTSRQVILVHSPDPKLFEQAIFILRDGAPGEGVTDDALLKEAQQLLSSGRREKKRHLAMYGAVWACAGAVITGLFWLASVML